jgi:hypothetical protein
MSDELTPQESVAYGSLYLDDNEDPEEITEQQIESFREQLPKFVFFDVICKPDQIAEAMAARGYIAQEFQAELDMDFYQVYVAIGFSESDRPARTAMEKYFA